LKAITKIADLVPDDQNATKGTERGHAMIEQSLRQYGAGRSILIDREGRIIAGNKTVENAGAVGLEDLVVVQSDGKRLVAVQRMDLDLKRDKAAKEMAIADNRSGEINLEWAGDVLMEMGKDIDLTPFFSAKELAAIVAKGVEFDAVPEPKMDQAAELQKKWVTENGQLWQIPAVNAPGGAHRLLCGDSTRSEDVARLWADLPKGAIPTLMVTDPPYGVEYDPEWRAERGVNKNQDKMGKVANDDQADWTLAWALFPGDVAYVWHASWFTSAVQASLESVDFEIRCEIIWAKDRFALSRGHYHWQHEPCWYAVRKGKAGHWLGARDQSTVWNIDAREDGGRGHGTQKPVECMRRPLQNHEGNVYDPFLGSGTTICAAEQLGRLCHGVELEPKYVAVILERLSEMGLTPELVK
jgi:DNA modification methylase